MKKTHNGSKSDGRGALREGHVSRLIVKPLLAEMKRQRGELFKLAGKILNKVNAVDTSVSVIAAEIKRQLDRKSEVEGKE